MWSRTRVEHEWGSATADPGDGTLYAGIVTGHRRSRPTIVTYEVRAQMALDGVDVPPMCYVT